MFEAAVLWIFDVVAWDMMVSGDVEAQETQVECVAFMAGWGVSLI